MKNLLGALAAIVFLFTNCSKTESIETDNNKNGQVKLKFDLIVNGKKLVLNDYTYTNSNGESFNISLLKFYVSNIVLGKPNGETYTVPKMESFFLIDAQDNKSLYPIISAPEGEYSYLQFNLGVDSLTNTLPAEQRTGVLDVSKHDMYWTWNSGYIHFKIEGASPQANTVNNQFKYHIGFFGGYSSPTPNNNRIITLDLSKAGISKVQENLSSDIHLMVDIGKIFDAVHTISISEYPTIMTQGPHEQMADNYATMFTHDHTHNFQKIN